jgi:hypothetical protein
LIDLEHQLARHVVQQENRPAVGPLQQMVGLSGVAAGAASGHPLGGTAAGVSLALMKSAIDSPAIRSSLASALRRSTDIAKSKFKTGVPIVIRGISPNALPKFGGGRASGGLIDRIPTRKMILDQLRQPQK